MFGKVRHRYSPLCRRTPAHVDDEPARAPPALLVILRIESAMIRSSPRCLPVVASHSVATTSSRVSAVPIQPWTRSSGRFTQSEDYSQPSGRGAGSRATGRSRSCESGNATPRSDNTGRRRIGGVRSMILEPQVMGTHSCTGIDNVIPRMTAYKSSVLNDVVETMTPPASRRRERCRDEAPTTHGGQSMPVP